MNTLGIKLQTIAKTKNITQQEIANNTGISKATVSTFFSGKSDISSNNLIKILSALDIDFSHIIDRNLDLALSRSNVGTPGDLLDELFMSVSNKLKKKNVIKSITNLAKEYEHAGIKNQQIYNTLKNYNHNLI